MNDFPPPPDNGPVISAPLVEPLQATLSTAAEPVTDTWTVRMVVISLLTLGTLALVADAVLAFLVIVKAYDAQVEGQGVVIDASVALLLGGLLSIATGCLGALSAILASTRGMFTKNL